MTRAIHLNWPYLKKLKSRHWFPSVDYCNLRLITLFGLKENLWRKIIAISDFAFPFCALLAFNGKIGNWALKRESPFLRGIQQIFTRWKKKRRRKRLKIWVVLSSIRRRGSRSKECRLSPSSSARELAPHMPWMGPHLRIFGGFHVPSSYPCHFFFISNHNKNRTPSTKSKGEIEWSFPFFPAQLQKW